VAEVDSAYAGAHAAQLVWAKTPLHARCALLHKVAALMRENKEAMAHCLVKEVAKPAKDSMTEVVRSGCAARGAGGERKGSRALQNASLCCSSEAPAPRQVRSADLIDYTAEEGIRILSEGARAGAPAPRMEVGARARGA
jgi:hypothetical protein